MPLLFSFMLWSRLAAGDWVESFSELGHEDFRVRQAAEMRISVAGRMWESIAFHRALHGALISDDAHVRRCAERIRRETVSAPTIPLRPTDLP